MRIFGFNSLIASLHRDLELIFELIFLVLFLLINKMIGFDKVAEDFYH